MPYALENLEKAKKLSLAVSIQGGALDVCSPPMPQLALGMSWMMIWTWSAGTPISTKTFVIPLISFAFWSSVFPTHVSTITTGMFFNQFSFVLLEIDC
jgi:hypothetical protein